MADLPTPPKSQNKSKLPHNKSPDAAQILLGYARDEDVKALFELFGMIAKADGTVRKKEIEEVERFISAQIPSTQREFAISCFRNGKELPLGKGTVTTRAFQLYGFRDNNMTERWLEPLQIIDILLRLAFSDEIFSDNEAYIVEWTRETLAVHKRSYWILRDTIAARMGVEINREGPSFQDAKAQSHSESKKPSKSSASLTKENALATLGLTEGATPKEIKNKYRSLVKLYHPDLIMSQGSEENIKAAALQFCEVRDAYEFLNDLISRG